MSDEESAFALPPFNAEAALVQIKRQLRDLKLSERGNHFELRGKLVLELAVDGAQINARLARKLALTPEFDKQLVAQHNDQRKLIEEVKKRLTRWEREE
jgi:hypothetical protein